MADNKPAIPAHLQWRPTSAGLVVPVPTPRTADGTYLFGLLERRQQQRLLLERRCQICEQRLGDRLIVFARPGDLHLRCTSEPALCPPCAAYSTAACPMLSGSMDHYRRQSRTGLADIPADTGGEHRAGAPADAWFAVWLADYDVVVHPIHDAVLAASWLRHPPLTIRPIPAG